MNRTIKRAETPPRANLLRMAPFALRADDGEDQGDGRTLDGYGAVFNQETIIDSWEGRFREKISPGAMKKSFREKPPIIQFDHGRHPVVGSIPIAELRSISEEVDAELAPEGGAHVIGRLMDNWLVEPVRDAIAAKSINGMSFRFSVVREQWFDAEGKRISDEETLFDLLRRTWYEDVPDDELLLRDLRELKVPEIGPVVWPAYQETSVGVRDTTVVIDLGRLDDPEQRKTLARAVFLADAAERPATPEVTDLRAPAGERDTSRATGRQEKADDHDQRAENDPPRATGRQDAPAGKHASMSQGLMKAHLARMNGRLELHQRFATDAAVRRGRSVTDG